MYPHGIQWGDRHFDLNSITSIRWELERVTVNFIYRTTSCTVGLADQHGVSTIKIRNELTYWQVVNFLWQATAGRLMQEACQVLASGETLTCGPITIADSGITVKRGIALLGTTRLVQIPLSTLKINLGNGSYRLSSLVDKNSLVLVGYGNWNVHVLFHLLRLACYRRTSKISEAF